MKYFLTSIAFAATLGAAGLGAVPAFAQQAPAAAAPAGAPQQGHGGKRMGQILMSLNLTDDQKAKIKQIMADARAQNQNVTDRDQRRANFKAAYAKIDTVLTPAQDKELHEKLDAMRAQYQKQQQGSN